MKEIEKQARTLDGFENLISIPGVGAYSAAALLVEIGSIDRFENAKQLASYFGLDPVKHSSGERTVDVHRISKKGTNYVRGLLDQCDRPHVRHAPESSLTRTYERVAKGEESEVAKTAVMRKLVKVAFHVLKGDRAFMLQGSTPGPVMQTPGISGLNPGLLWKLSGDGGLGVVEGWILSLVGDRLCGLP